MLNNKYIKVISAIMYCVSFSAAVCLLSTDFEMFTFTHAQRIVTASVIFIFGYLASLIRCSRKNKTNAFMIMRRTTVLLFVAYMAAVVEFTLADGSFGREISNFFFLNGTQKAEYFNYHTNFVPFHTIKLFIGGYKNGNVVFSAFFENVIGNFFVFMPSAFFFPAIIKRINNFWRYFLCIAIMVLVIEGLQLVFLTGSTDIDDFLLNIAGATMAYGILKIKFVGKFVNKATFGVWRYHK